MGAPLVSAPGHGMAPLDTSGHMGPSVSITHRDTRGGRRLWYRMKVIQQPERARACGSGPKSSADRRPVDPPPVVELRIYEGQTWDLAQEKDITFVYNANFFLFATLEHARMMAHARGTPAPSTNTPPVLTGMPVSGMAYLDRPQEAGYFLFPDLSVRHEGRYKLTFNLYEETKDEKDKEPEREGESQPPIPGLNPATGGSFDFRMEVKSQEFIVYSAKKFPGLAESTQLSRVVAEQGCRVRIRRDVRMRRRDGKGGNGDYENAEEEYSRRRRTATPDTRPDYNRARSTSGSLERTPYSADSQRRPSIADYQPQYPSQSQSSGGHLQFLGGNGNSQYPAQPPQNFAQPPSVPASPVYQQSQGVPYQPQTSYHPPPPPPPPPPAPRAYSRERTPSQSSSYAPITSAPHRPNVQLDSRPTLPPLLPQSYYPSASPRQQMHAPPHREVNLPSIRLPMPNSTAMPSPTALSGGPLPPLNTRPMNPLERPALPQYAGTKRAHDQTFRQEPELPRYQDGARDKGMAEDLDPPVGEFYYRADGSRHSTNKFGGMIY